MDVYSMSDEEVQKLINERINETVENLGKHIDRTYTQQAEHWKGTMWVDEPPRHCVFEEQAVRDARSH